MKKFWASLFLILFTLLVIFLSSEKVTFSENVYEKNNKMINLLNDKSEGSVPDYQKLSISYNEYVIKVKIDFYSEVEVDSSWMHLYLYGLKKDVIYITSSNFTLRRDNDNNGHFEEILLTGKVTNDTDTSIEFEIPIKYIKDISEKKVWGYSLQSEDRIPDVGVLMMSNY